MSALAVRWLIALMAFLCLATSAWADTPITLFESFAGNVNFVGTEKTLRTQPNTSDPCAITTGTTTATLSGIPSTATIRKAYLYWAGSGTNDFTVTFDSTALTATRQYTATWSGNNFFSGVVDVTAQVVAKRNNSYSLANLTVNNGYTYCSNETVLGGWALLAIYEDASQPFRVLNLYEGFQAYQYDSITLSLSNFQIPTPLGTATGRHGHITWEGDPTLSGGGESLVFNGYELTDGTNPSGNQFNSASNITSPVDTVSYGVDFDAYTIGAPTIAAGQTSATTVYSSGQDLVFLSAEMIAVPNVPVADLALTMSLSGSLVQGQNATYVLTVGSNGPISEPGPITVTDTLPAGLSFVAGSAGWSCSAAGQTVTCTHAGPLASGAYLDTLTLTAAVSSSVTGSLTNSATVSGTLFDNVASNSTASVSATVVEQHCTTSNVGTDVLVTCTGNGFLTIPSDIASVRYLVVGGGGGGGGTTTTRGAGGGGAGGVLSGSSFTVTAGATYTVTVGAAGTAGSGTANGGSGGASTFATLTASGGGGGARGGDITGSAGGSGGGGSGSGSGGSGTSGQGNAGGAGSGTFGNQRAGGGGGGAGAAGAAASGQNGGNGGNGVSNDITGTATYYGGGGGGGAYDDAQDGNGGSGGSGGGGAAPNSPGNGSTGTPNTGGGGGGASAGTSGNNYIGGTGGAGVVIVRYSGPRLTIADASLTEGNAGTTNMNFTVTLSRAAGSTVTVAYTLSNGTATGGASCTSGVDFINTGGTLTFNAGVTTQTIAVPICGDTTYESDETFTVSLSSPVNAALGSPSSATGMIVNDDTPALIAEYRFDETSWNGTSGEVKDSSGNAYNATRGGSATTATTTPAYTSGSQSTCYYGVFSQSGTPSSYVQLPTGFPSLSTDFTLSAWIRTTNIGKIGQRIVVRDDNNDGWALSLSDATAGTIRVFNRSISYTSGTLSGGTISSGGVALDTPVVIANNTWYFVSAVVNLASKSVTIYVYNTAGTQLAKTSASFTGTWNVGTGATAIGSETSASSENALYFSGNIDEVRVYNGALTQSLVEGILPTTRVCSCTLGSFRITQDSTALACPDTRAAVTVVPLCVDGVSVKNDYAGTVALGTTPTGGTFYSAQTGGSSVTGLTFIIGDLSKTVYLYYPNETGVCVTASEGTVTSTSTSCTAFHAYGFRVTQQPADGVCGNSTTIQLTAYGKNESGAGCSTITGFAGGKNLKAWFTSGIDTDNPSTVQASNRTLSMTGSAAGISNSSEPGTANLSSVTFTNGVATLTASYPNAAKIFGVNFKHDASPYNGTTCTATAPFCPLTAVTGAFLAYPNFALGVTDGGSACAAGDATCAVFKAAGDSFNMKLQALCADGSTLATDYKNGTSPIPLAVNALVAPLGGQTGSVGTTTTNITSGGEQAFTQSWSEVGVATFKATPPVWFGHSFAAATTGNIGRFNPKSFGLSNGFIGNRMDFATTGSVAAGAAALTVASAAGLTVGESIDIPGAGVSGAVLNSLVSAIAGTTVTLATAAGTTVANAPVLHAGAFTYMGEPFLAYFTLTALNAAGAKTQNYTGAFARLSGAVANTWTTYSTDGSTQALGLGAVNGATALTSRLANIAGQSGSFNNGVGNFTAQMTLGRAAAGPDGPYLTSVGVAPQDTDGVHLRAADITLNADPPDATNERGLVGTLTQRFGRLWLGNAYGSELRGLAVPYETQFWNGFAFVRNADDNLMPFASNNISLATSLTTTVTLANLAAGAGTISLSAPGAQGTVDVYVNLGSANGNCPGYAVGTTAARTYLSGRWCGANFDRDPVSRATFGIQAGRRGPIYIRENY